MKQHEACSDDFSAEIVSANMAERKQKSESNYILGGQCVFLSSHDCYTDGTELFQQGTATPAFFGISLE